MLINLSNHPSALWEQPQVEAALPWGRVEDLPFPLVDPAGDGHHIEALARDYLDRILRKLKQEPGPHAVHLMGELTFCFALAQLLTRQGIDCVASTTQREVVSQNGGDKTSRFSFVQFRAYPVI